LPADPLWRGPGGGYTTASRIHDGLVFSNRSTLKLLHTVVSLLFSVTLVFKMPVVMVTDASYASGKVITPLLKNGHHLVSQAKSNAVAYLPALKTDSPKRGRPMIYGRKVKLKDMAGVDCAFTSAPRPVYGESDVTLQYRVLDWVWKPVGHLVRFVIVRHPLRGTIFLLSTDLSMQALENLGLYGYRLNIEVGFKQAVHLMGAFGYHFLDERHEAGAQRPGRSVSAPNQ
jgi:hypothetical protein